MKSRMAKSNGMITNPLVHMIEESIRLKDSAQDILSGAVGGTTLTRLERLVLIFICESDELMTAPQIGRHSGHSRQVIHRAAGQLESLGLIEKFDNPDHKTAALLKPTVKGLEFQNKMRTTMDSIISGLLTRDELQVCERIAEEICQLREKIERYDSEGLSD